jgi:hypothetical protein
MLQLLQKASQTDQSDVMEDFTKIVEKECAKENRVVNLRAQSANSPPIMRPSQRTPKRVSTDQALQSVKRMREQDNALSSKIIQNLQSDKAAFALKMEELQNFLSSTKQRCVALESSVGTLVTENERLEGCNKALQEQVEELQESAAQQASTISQLENELQQEKAKNAAQHEDPAEVELLKLAKSYLKQTLQLQRTKSGQIRPASKNNWQSDSLVAQCNGCSKRFGTFLRRHHCRGCGKLFCGACCQDNLQLLTDSGETGVHGVIDGISHLTASDEHKGPATRQRSCKDCFKQAEETQAKKKQLQEQSKVELRAMEDWLARPEVNLASLLSDDTHD